MLASVGDRVAPGSYGVHSTFEHAVNFSSGEDLVSVVDETIGPGPLHLVFERGTLPRGPRLRIEAGSIEADGVHWTLEARRRYRSRVSLDGRQLDNVRVHLPRLRRVVVHEAPAESAAGCLELACGPGPDPRTSGLGARTSESAGPDAGGSCALQTLGTHAAAVAARFRDAAHAVAAGRFDRAVRLVRGCGPGLTPSGDDFNAGLLLALTLRHGERSEASWATEFLGDCLGSNLLSSAFLRMSAEGRVTAKVRELLEALAAPGAPELERHARRVLALGHSSGADFLTGFLLGFDAPTDVRSRQRSTVQV